MDSGASSSHCIARAILENIVEENHQVATADGYIHSSSESGRIGKVEGIKYTPSFNQNLLSVSQLVDLGYEVTFSPNGSFVKPYQSSKMQDHVINLKRKGGLFYLKRDDIIKLSAIDECYVASTRPLQSLITWHQRTHLSDDLLIKLSHGYANGIDIEDDFLMHNLSVCETCAITKAEKNGRRRKKKRTLPNENLEQVDTDVKVVNILGYRAEKYILSFRCARSKYTWLYFMRNKNDARDCLQDFKINVLKQLNEHPKINTELNFRRLHSDGGGEFLGEFEKLCQEFEIRHTITPPYNPELNSFAESYWRILMQTTRAFLHHAELPTKLWTYACSYANFILNRTLLRPIEGILKTSYEWLYNEKPDLARIRTWGTPVYSLIPEQQRVNKSLGNRSNLGYFVGFADNYVHSVNIYSPNGSIAPHKIEDVIYNEIIKPRIHIDTGTEAPDVPYIEDNQQDIEKQSTNSADEEEEQKELKKKRVRPIKSAEIQRRSKRIKEKHMKIYRGRVARTYMTLDLTLTRNKLTEEEIRVIQRAEESHLTPELIQKWLQAIEKEKTSIMLNDVFEVVKRPQNQRTLRTMWVLTKKMDEHGNELSKKARNVLLGNLTQEGVDYYETFSPVAKLSSIRLFLALVVQFRMQMFQGDFNTAFLNATIDESIYLEVPLFFRMQELIENLPKEHALKREHSSALCLKLKKSQYGLKQSSRNWYLTLNEYLINTLNFEPCKSEPCIYTLRTDNHRTILFVYVDDFILASTSETLMNSIVDRIEKKYKIKRIGEPRSILGISIKRVGDEIHLSQHGKIEAMIKEYHLENAARVSVPLDPDHKLTKEMKSRKDKESIYHPDHPNSKADQLTTKYRSIVGKLNHISQATRPDIAYSVAVLSKYLNKPCISHLYAALRVVKYLNSTKYLGIRYKRDPFKALELEAYSDSDWAGDIDTRRSQSGTILMLAGGPVHWISSVQHVVSLSSAEAEVIALKQTVKETLWLRNMLQETYMIQQKPIKVFGDNSSALKIITNPIISKKNRHMEIGYYFIASHLEIGSIKLEKVEGVNNYADIMTKYLKLSQHEQLITDLLHPRCV